MALAAAATAKSLQSCLTLCDPIDGSPPGSSIPGILQARTLEGVAVSFSNAWKWKVKVKLLSRTWLLATAWTAAYQAPPSMGFSRQEYWSGLPLPSPSFAHTCIQKTHPAAESVQRGEATEEETILWWRLCLFYSSPGSTFFFFGWRARRLRGWAPRGWRL